MDQKKYDERFSELFKIEVGKRLKAWRKHRYLSQKELGKQSSLNPEHISNIELGKNKIFLETLGHLNKVLDLDTNKLINDSMKTAYQQLDQEK